MIPSLVVALSLIAQSASATPLVTRDERSFTITFDPAGTPLLDFVKAVSRALEWPLQYQLDELQEDRLFASEPQIVPREHLADYVHNILRSHDLIITTVGEGPSAMRSLVRISKSKPGMLKSLAPYVSSEDLLAMKPSSAPLVTTQIVLRHTSARELATSLTGYFADQMVESVRNVEDANGLVITGWTSTVRNIVKMAAMIDEMASAGTKELHAPLKQQLTDLEKRIASLETALRSVGQQLPPPSR